MATKRFSQMTVDELNFEIEYNTDQARKAKQLGRVNEVAVFEQKVVMAKSYLLNPEDYLSGEEYEVIGEPGTTFKIDYMNGVFAWGYRVGGNMDEEALPIARLGNKVN